MAESLQIGNKGVYLQLKLMVGGLWLPIEVKQ